MSEIDQFECKHENCVIETEWEYNPTQQQIDEGTDHDEEVRYLVCKDCGKQLENKEEDYYE